MDGTILKKLSRRKFVISMNTIAAAAAFPPGVRSFASGSPSASGKLAADPRRPQFHFLPAANWMNDPNGPIFWKGNYHMFYQYNPNGAYWGDMHWGHAISTDMVHWRHLPLALAPTPNGPDRDGCFTGTAIVKDDQVLLMYTGVQSAPEDQATIKDGTRSLLEKQCLAASKDPELKTWAKIPEAVIATPPQGLAVNGFRDPSPWHQGEWWYTVLGSGVANRGGAVLLYRSKDLRTWDFMHVLAQRDQEGVASFDPYDPWEVWECPEFFALGDMHVLIYSTSGKAYWQAGKLDPEAMVFHPVQSGILDYGSYYAPKTQLDRSGNRVLWGWIQEARPLDEYKAAGWAGMMSLPRMLSLGPDGRLRMHFVSEVNQLRRGESSWSTTGDEEENLRQIASIRLKQGCGEILCTAQVAGAPFEMVVTDFASPHTPLVSLACDIDRRSPVSIDARPLPISLINDICEIQLYVDGSVIEVIVNGQAAWTKRFYPKENGAAEIGLQWKGSTNSIKRLTAWQIAPISDNRLTE